MLFNLHLPSDPSLNDNDTGTFGSLTIVPQDVNTKTESKIIILNKLLGFLKENYSVMDSLKL